LGSGPGSNLQNSSVELVLRTHSLKELTGIGERYYGDHEMFKREGEFKVS
jgi:hypothetical protein